MSMAKFILFTDFDGFNFIISSLSKHMFFNFKFGLKFKNLIHKYMLQVLNNLYLFKIFRM